MRERAVLEARMRDALSAGVIMCGLLSGCVRTRNALRDLPELPAEFAQDLAVARTGPVLMTRPAATPAPVVPGSRGNLALSLREASYRTGRACLDRSCTGRSRGRALNCTLRLTICEERFDFGGGWCDPGLEPNRAQVAGCALWAAGGK